MMNRFFTLLLATSCLTVRAQVTIEQNFTIEEYVNTVLLGDVVSASNITYIGDPIQVAKLTDESGNFSVSEGLVLSSGDPNRLSDCQLDNNPTGLGQEFVDQDLLAIANSVPPLIGQSFIISSVQDGSVIEFDFEAGGDCISFNYVFGSDEYLAYVNTQYNDIFAFFLSGPGIVGPYASPVEFPDGAINLAQVPDSEPGLPITISSVNNTINPEYYIDNPTQEGICINGFTTKFTASAAVQCGETYHIKLAIADGSDSYLESIVVLEAGSFNFSLINGSCACVADLDLDGICDDEDPCVGEFDACGLCNGGGAVYECGCTDIPEGECDCDGNQLDALGACGGECTSDINSNGVCDDSEINGCTYPIAENYDPLATDDDGSCILDNTGNPGCELVYDGNGDGAVGSGDLLGLLTEFGSVCEPEVALACGDAVSYQGYDYATVLIGEQCWFAENLRSENYENGDAIPANLSDSEWQNTTSGAVTVYGEGSSDCWNESPDGDACDEAWSLNEYGRLYNWYAVDDARGLCPSGWYVPTDGDWMTMEMALGMSEVVVNGTGWRGTDQGTQMKTTYGWNSGGNGTNSSGFSGLPGGYRNVDGNLLNAGEFGYWWSSSPDGSDAWGRYIYRYYERVSRSDFNHRLGLSVRCIKDSE